MKRFKLLALLSLIFLVLACEKKEEAYITLTSDEAVTVSVEGDAVSIKFTTNVPWTASSSADWLTITPTSGEGVKGGADFTVKASALKNETTDSRAATVTITDGAAITKKVTITQNQKDALEVDVVEYSVEADGGVVEVSVNANVDYSVSIPEAVDWVHVASGKGMVTSTVSLLVDPNWEPATDEAPNRSANITITDGALSKTIKITQAPFEPYFELTGEWAGLQWSAYGEATVIPREGISITIPVETNLDWEPYFSYWSNELGASVRTNDLGWVHLSFDKEKAEIYLTFDENDTNFQRDHYFYIECFLHDGSKTGAFGGTGHFVQEGKKIEGAAYEMIWHKTLTELGIPAAYNRLAVKTAGGPALIVSDGAKIHALGPNNGAYYKAITWGTVVPASICSDDAGNVIVADHTAMSAGTTYSVYYASDVNSEPIKLFDQTSDFGGTIGGWRVRGDISTAAMITAVVGGDPAYWAGWEIKNKAVSLDNYYVQGTGGQNRGPATGTVWSPVNGACMSLGTTAADGVYFRGYDGTRAVQYLATATYPNWVTAYDWKPVITGIGDGSNESQNCMSIVDYNGKRIMAMTQGYHFGYSSLGDIYVLDVTDANNPVMLLDIPATEWIITEGNEFSGQSASDVLLRPGDGVLELYAINSGRGTLARFNVVFQ
jgi:hypothetical protein